MFEDMIIYICEFMFEWADYLLLPLVNLLPDISLEVTSLVTALKFISSFFPLDFGITYLCLYLQFILSMIVVKLTFKLFVPFVG